MASDKTCTKKINPYSIRKKDGIFAERELVTSRQEMSERANFHITLLFFEKK